MRIKVGNILAALVGLVLVFVAWKHGDDLARFFGSIGSIGPGHPPDDQARGLLALGLLGLAAVVVARLLLRDRIGRRGGP